MKPRFQSRSKKNKPLRTATAARRSTAAKHSEQKPEQKISKSRLRLLEATLLDRKAALRHKRFEQTGTALPRLREEVKKENTKNPSDHSERLQKILASAGICS